MAICNIKHLPKTIKICQSKFKMLPNFKRTFSELPKGYSIAPKWWDFCQIWSHWQKLPRLALTGIPCHRTANLAPLVCEPPQFNICWLYFWSKIAWEKNLGYLIWGRRHLELKMILKYPQHIHPSHRNKKTKFTFVNAL